MCACKRLSLKRKKKKKGKKNNRLHIDYDKYLDIKNVKQNIQWAKTSIFTPLE